MLGRLTSAEIAGVVRTAFDPAARGEVGRVLAAARAGQPHGRLGWADAGPVGAEEHPDHYRHDSGISVSWAWQEAPRQNVTADVLARLVAPGPYPKRVSAAVPAAPRRGGHPGRWRPRSTPPRSASTTAAAPAATRPPATPTTRPAPGRPPPRRRWAPGSCLISLYVTVTVIDPERLPQAVAATEAAAESSKIRLRRMTYSQAAGFAATLPCGICPAELARRMPH